MISARTAALWILLGFAALLAEGCRIGEKYERPELDVPETYRGIAAEGESIASLSWWELFNDQVLCNLIRVALEENKDLRLATARIRQARGFLKAVRAEEMPQIDAVAGAEFEQPSKEIYPGADVQEGYGVGAALSWELDLWGELRSATDAAIAELIAEEEARRGIVITLVADVARSYFTLRDLDNRLEISRQTVESRRKAFGIAKLRFEGGITSELEVKQTEVELARAEADIPELEHDITVTENVLSILLGRNPGEIERGRALTEQTLLPAVPAGLPSELLKRRPDIRVAEHDLIAANARVRVALAQFYPQISLTAEAGLENDRFRRMARGDAFTWNWALAGIFRVFDWGRNQGNLEVARAVYDQALVQYEIAIQQSFREVSDVMSLIHHTRKLREREEALLQATRDYRRLALTRYLHGDVSLLETLDADRQLFNAQLSLSSTIREQLNSMVLLYRALGGGWQAEEEEGEEEGKK